MYLTAPFDVASFVRLDHGPDVVFDIEVIQLERAGVVVSDRADREINSPKRPKSRRQSGFNIRCIFEDSDSGHRN